MKKGRGGGQMSRGRRGRMRPAVVCRTRYIYEPVSAAHDKSPVAVRASIVSRRGYFNILKFHPKRVVYQNLRHKLLAVATPPPSPPSRFAPADILHLHSPGAEIVAPPSSPNDERVLHLPFRSSVTSRKLTIDA